MKVNSGKLLSRIETADQVIEVRENRRFRWLHFDDDVFQSVMDLKQPHRLTLQHMPVMLGIFQFITKPKRILLLGLGGGSLAHYLQRHYPDCHLTIVEINPIIIDVAKKYFYLPPTSDKFTIINADAQDYFRKTQEQFDAILLDIYTKNNLPACCYETGFYEQTCQHLHENGAMTANFLCHAGQDFLQILQKLRSCFNGQTLCLPVKHYNNLIVYALKSASYKEEIFSLMEKKNIEDVQFDPELGLCAKKIRN